MRAIELKISSAFNAGTEMSESNTTVIVEKHLVNMYLHGYHIAQRNTKTNTTKINMCGYNTNVTRSRLNTITNVSVRQKDGKAILNGKEIPTNKWVFVK